MAAPEKAGRKGGRKKGEMQDPRQFMFKKKESKMNER